MSDERTYKMLLADIAGGGSGGGLPDYSEANDGDVLAIESGEPSWASPASGLPDYSGASDGDVLTLDNGEPTWAAPSGGGGQRVQVNIDQNPDTGDTTISIEGEETLTDEEMNYYLINAVENNATIYLSFATFMVVPTTVIITDVGSGESIIHLDGLIVVEATFLMQLTVSCVYIGTAPNGRYEMRGAGVPFQLTPVQ